MSTQAEFDQKISAAVAALDASSDAILAEAQQIREYLEANPSIDASALDGVVTRLEAQAAAVSGVFEPPVVETPAEGTSADA